jgi:hypothetical protein
MEPDVAAMCAGDVQDPPSRAWYVMSAWLDRRGGLREGTFMVRASSQSAVRGYWRPPVPAGGRCFDDVFCDGWVDRSYIARLCPLPFGLMQAINPDNAHNVPACSWSGIS